MSEQQGDGAPQETPEAPLRGAVVLQALPVMAVASWVLAVGVAAVWLNPPAFLSDGGFAFYGLDAPDWVFVLFTVLSLAALVTGFFRPGLLFPFLAAAFLLPLGTGARLLVRDDVWRGDLAAAMAFAGALLLLVEFQTAIPRFREVVRAARSLAREERTHVNRFLVRYLGLAALLGVGYAGLAFLLAGHFYPLLAVSERMRDGLELRTALGITVFSIILLSIPILIRLVVEGIQDRMRATAPEEAEP